MLKSKFKFLSVALSFVLLLSMMQACIFSPIRDDAAEDEITISRWASAMEEAQFRAWTDKFTESHPEIKVKWNFLPYEAHFSSLRTSLIGGTASDIVCLNDWGWFGYRNADNTFVDFNTVPEMQDTINGLIPRAKESFISKTGKRLALANGTVTRRPIVNVDDFNTAGVTVPYDRTSSFTLQEISDLFSPIVTSAGVHTAGNNMKIGVNFNETELMFIMAASAGAPIYDPVTKKIGVDTPAGHAAMKELRQFYRRNGSGVGNTNNEMVQVPLAQSASYSNDGVLESTLCVAAYSGAYNYQHLTDLGFNIAAIPTVKATGGTDTLLLEFNNFAVPASSQKKNMAYTFMKWALSEAGQLAFSEFSDLPTNATAYDKVTTTWDEHLYSAMNIGINNVYVMTSLPDDFAFGSILADLLETPGNDDTAVTTFINALKELESALADM